MKMTDKPALEIQNITHHFGARCVLDDVSLSVNEGEIVCLIGPSGSGKTTLLRLIAGLEPVKQGSLRLKNRSITDLPAEQRQIGLVFQDYALFPHLNVQKNICFGLKNQKIKRPTQKRRTKEILKNVDMQDYAESYPHMLSGGQQQRVALARALVMHPSVMLLDEPFVGLDSRLRAEVRDQTLHILKQSGAAVLLVTHDPEEAMFLADHIILMQTGKIVQTGTPEALYTKPCNSFSAGFFGEINRLTGIVKKGMVKTPLGSFKADQFLENQPVEILLRPEHIHLSDPVPKKRASPTALVLAARFLGRASLIHLHVKGKTEQEDLHLHARAPGYFLPEDGKKLVLHVDPEKAFVFPMEETASKPLAIEQSLS